MTEEMFFNSYWITIDDQNRITSGWSDGPNPDRDTSDAVLLTNQGEGYQFRLFPNGEENPQLFNMQGIPLYKWDGKKAIKRSESEIQADIDALPEPEQTIPLEARVEYVEKAIEILSENQPVEVQSKIMSLGAMLYE